MTQPRTTHTTKTGIALPEGSFSPANYVGDPNGGAFVDWGAEFMAKGLASPAEANEFGTPSMWKGMPTGFGKPAGAGGPPQGPPPHGPPQGPPARPAAPPMAGQAAPPMVGHQGPPMMGQAPPMGTPGAGVPAAHPAMMAAGGRQMPFASQLAPMLASMGHPMAPQGYPTQGPPVQAPQANAQQIHAPQVPKPAAPHAPPPAHQQQQPHAAMGAWIDWEAAMSALMGELDPSAGQGGPPAPPPTPPKPPKSKRPGSASVGGRGAGSKPFTYGEDDAAAQKSLAALAAGFQKSLGQGSRATPQPSRRAVPARAAAPVFRDPAGRALAKGLYAFRDPGGRDQDLPEEYLYDYLCAFIEEAYEHESREPEHQQLQAREQVVEMSRAVMSELVQTIPRNKNLMRAAKKYDVTRASIEAILVVRGIFKPRAGSAYSDDGNSAMGAHSLTAAIGDFAFSRSHEIAPFLQPELAPPTARKIAVRHDDVSHLVKSDAMDPARVFIEGGRRGAEARGVVARMADPVARAAPECPVHTGREIHKAMNLWNPMLPCTCHGKPNAHG